LTVVLAAFAASASAIKTSANVEAYDDIAY
jgi:hypothetical protein